MLSVTTAQLNAWLVAYLLPFFRLLAFMSADLVLGNTTIPARVRIGLAMALTLVVAPLLPVAAIDPGSSAGLLALIMQVVIGLTMGFALRVVFVSAEMAGELIGLQMGLGFATFFDPQHGPQIPIVGSFIGLLALLLFFTFNVHLWLIEALVQSFHLLPVSASPLDHQGAMVLLRAMSSVFVFALKLGLPMVAGLLAVNLALGVMTRAAPQLNLFSVGFPITLAAGFILLALILPALTPLFERYFADGLNIMLDVLDKYRLAVHP